MLTGFLGPKQIGGSHSQVIKTNTPCPWCLGFLQALVQLLLENDAELDLRMLGVVTKYHHGEMAIKKPHRMIKRGLTH